MHLHEQWKTKLGDILESHDFQAFMRVVDSEYEKYKICPPRERIFHAFNLCPPDKVRVVVLGQDPYFNKGQATGLAFSIHPGTKPFPPSLQNIIKEVTNNFGECRVTNGDLEPWARQGVLLFNTCLTVREGACFSHKDLGWDLFINAVMKKLNEMGNIIFVLWGSNARKYQPLVTNKSNYVLTSSHPSPLSAHNGFFGCGHFMKINEILVKGGDEDIKW